MRRPAAKLILLTCCLSAVASARPPSPQASDSWVKPAAASARYADAPRLGADEVPGRFQFKDSRPLPPAPPANPFGKAPVSAGALRIDPDGRPAVNCALAPMDARCR